MAGAFIPYPFNQRNAERGSFSHSVFGLCLLANLLACSCATPYKALNHRYGYSDQQVGSEEFEVTFLGNGNSSFERAFDFAMLRTTEIALSRQAKSFILLDLINLSSVRRYQTSSHYYWTASPFLSAGAQTAIPAPELIGDTEQSYLMMVPAQEGIFYRPGVKLKVRLLSDPPGSYYPYDPAKENERLKRKYRIKPDSQPVLHEPL